MHVLLLSPRATMTVVDTKSPTYTELYRMGYLKLFKGSEKQCEQRQEFLEAEIGKPLQTVKIACQCNCL